MNKKIENAWEWVKEHKTEVACGTITMVVGGVILFAAGRASHPIERVLRNVEPIKVRERFDPKLSIGNCVDCVHYPDRGSTELLIDNVPLNAMGELMAEVCEKVPNITENAVVYTLLSIKHDEVNNG